MPLTTASANPILGSSITGILLTIAFLLAAVTIFKRKPF